MDEAAFELAFPTYRHARRHLLGEGWLAGPPGFMLVCDLAEAIAVATAGRCRACGAACLAARAFHKPRQRDYLLFAVCRRCGWCEESP